MEDLRSNGQLGEEIEAEWQAVVDLLAKGEEASWAMAVVEAHKIFSQVLAEVSFGEDFEEMVHNASSVFRNLGKILAAHKIYEHITISRIGHRVRRADAQAATDDLMRGILDMTGRDYVSRGGLEQMMNSLNFFWTHHPRFLAWLIADVLVAVALIWFMADTTIGRFLVTLTIGFERFVIGFPGLLAGLVVALVFAILLGYWLIGRRDK